MTTMLKLGQRTPAAMARPVVPTPTVPTREQIRKAECFLATFPSRSDEIEMVHHFEPHLYRREMRAPGGVFITGRTHKTAHWNELAAGEITVWTEQGMKRLKAPFRFMSQPGTKRIGMTHTDVIWITEHVTDETDLAKLEAEICEPAEDLLAYRSAANEVMLFLGGAA